MRWLVAFAFVVGVTGCHKRHFRPFEHAHVHQHAVKVNAKGPDATLVTSGGGKLQLAEVLSRSERTVVVFYRGFY
jgi:hypothetical protein